MTDELGKLVLIADDDDELRGTMVEIVEGHGFRVIEASNGEDALTLALRDAPDVIVLDHRMPRMLGSDVVQELRKANCASPIVFATASRQAIETARGLGVKHWLGKPFGIDELLAILERALNERG